MLAKYLLIFIENPQLIKYLHVCSNNINKNIISLDHLIYLILY